MIREIPDDQYDIIIRCVKKWGINAQILKLGEESSEMTTTIWQMLNKQNMFVDDMVYTDDFVEEFADCQFLMDQVWECSPDDFKNKVRDVRKIKSERVRKHLGD